VEDIDNSSFNNEFRLHCRSRSFIIYAMTAEQKKEWVQDLKRSIEGTHPEEKKKNDPKKEEVPKDDVKKTKKEPKVEKADSDHEANDPEPDKKKEPRAKSKKTTKKVTKTEENVLPFDPFAPASGQQRPNNNNPNLFTPSPVTNPFLGVSAIPLQPNLIATAPLSNFDFGYNQQPAANMGFNLNQPPSNFNPNPLAVNGNSNPFNPSMGINQVNPNVAFNPSVNQPPNPYAQSFSVSGTNPFTAGSSSFNNNQPMTIVSNPFSSGPAQSSNPFLNSNPSSAPFSVFFYFI